MMQNSKHLRNSVPNLSLGANKKFNFLLPDAQVARGIANLLNENNHLNSNYNAYSVISNQVQYFVDLTGYKLNGCIGLKVENRMDKILHLSVDNSMRNHGIGKLLLNTAVINSDKETLYMFIRDDNKISMNIAINMGFRAIAYRPKFGYNVLTLCLFRRKMDARN